MKLRFDSPKGLLTVEDLWDLPLTSARGANLNDIAKGLNRELKAAADEDFVNRTAPTDTAEKLAFEVVKHVIDIRLAENEAAKLADDSKEKKARILEMIAHKQDEQLAAKPVEELLAMVESL